MEKTALEQALDQLEQAVATARAALGDVEGAASVAGDAAHAVSGGIVDPFVFRFAIFVLAIGDYVTPQILGGNNELLMPQLIMMQIGRRGDFPLASALSLVLMAVVTIAYLASARWLKIERT